MGHLGVMSAFVSAVNIIIYSCLIAVGVVNITICVHVERGGGIWITGEGGKHWERGGGSTWNIEEEGVLVVGELMEGIGRGKLREGEWGGMRTCTCIQYTWWRS